MKVQDFTLARQEVVLNVEPVHGFKMPPKHSNRNQVRNQRGLRVPCLNRAQRSSPRLQVRLVRFIPLRNTRIEVPADVVKSGSGGERLDLSAGLLLDMQKSNHHVGDLHARVVDVILDVHFPARKTQQPDERITKNGIPQMPDMRRLVGIDARMLDQHFAGVNIRGHERKSLERKIGGQRRSQFGAPYPDVDVPRARHLKFFKTGDRTDPGNDFLGNLARRLAKFPGKLKSDRQGVFAEFNSRRLLDDDVRDLQLVSAPQKLAQMFDQPMFQISIQRMPSTPLLTY